MGLALSQYDRALGALAQLGLNLGCLLVVGLATLTVQDRLLRRHGLPATRSQTASGTRDVERPGVR